MHDLSTFEAEARGRSWETEVRRRPSRRFAGDPDLFLRVQRQEGGGSTGTEGAPWLYPPGHNGNGLKPVCQSACKVDSMHDVAILAMHKFWLTGYQGRRAACAGELVL